MGFDLLPPIDVSKDQRFFGGARPELFQRAGCALCPLNHSPGLRHPKMGADGADRPVVYFLAEAPGEEEDRQGRPLIGPSGSVLREAIPRSWDNRVRFHNTIRCRPPNNREPSPVETECCRQYVTADIVASRPRAIFGLGNVALQWAVKQSGISKWRGRHLPVKIGDHSFWFFPIVHPASVLYSRDEFGGKQTEFAFNLDIKRAFAMVEALPEPVVHTRDDVFAGIDWVVGNKPGDLDRVLKHLDRMARERFVGFDYETNRLRPYYEDSKILSAALSGADATLAFALDHRESGWSKADRRDLDHAFTRFLHDAPCRKVSHMLAFEMEWSGVFYGTDCLHGSDWEDTVSQAYVLDDRVRMSKPDPLSLEFLGIQYFGINLKALSRVDRANLDDVPINDVLSYNGVDGKYHRLLYHAQAKALVVDEMTDRYRRHVSRVPAAVLSQIRGVPIDPDTVDSFYDKYERRLHEIYAEIEQLPLAQEFEQEFGRKYRPNADGIGMLDLLGIKSTTGDEKAFKPVTDPIGAKTIAWRKAFKVLGTYLKPLCDENIVFADGRLHPVYSTCQTRTGRTSSDSPNVQNYPKNQGESVEVRGVVKAPPGWKIVAIDYSSIQARNVAMESRDHRLVTAFLERYDIHSDWSQRVARLHPKWVKEGMKVFREDDKVARAYRQLAKNQFVFPTFFGANAKTVSGGLGIPETVGQRLLDEFWNEFPDIKKWHDRLRKSYYQLGYVTGLTGYRRHAPVSETELINTPIQADEADIVCDAWERLSRYDDENLHPIMMIHDDLTFLWPANHVDRLADIAIAEMVDVPFEWAHIVPIEVEMMIGDDWHKLSKVGNFTSLPGGGYEQVQ